MNETVLLIISYLPAVISLIGSVAAALLSIKKVSSKISETEMLRRQLGCLNKKLEEQLEKDEELKKEVELLRLQLKGFKRHEKSISKD